MIIKYPDGTTPLDPAEMLDLIPKYVNTHERLNRWEKRNIAVAVTWASRQHDILSLSFIQELHYRMFDQTWRWAGKFRLTEKNIGIAWHRIPCEIQKLCDDVRYHIDYSVFQPDEIAVRFHYKLVWIHPFPNGNGRHARLMADLLIKQLGHHPFSWGMRSDLVHPTPLRKRYINALLKADRGEGFEDLIHFARS
jgi:Fic-DOC domain mobile mystery protein B